MLKINLKKDCEKHIRAKFKELGFTYDENESLENNSITFHRISRRIIPKVKRKIYVSNVCSVPSSLNSGFNEVVRRLKNGEDVRPYQSRNTKKTKIHDLLLNDWAIHHFHLGDSLEPDGYVSRTGPLLYTMVTNDSAYLIAVLNHGQWTNKDLIQILHNNWEKMMRQFVLQSSPEYLTNEQRKTLRNSHKNALVTVSDGTTYRPLGGGIMSSGDACFDIINTDKLFSELEYLESILRSNAHNFYDSADININEDLKIKMVFEENGFYLIEPNINVRFNLNIHS